MNRKKNSFPLARARSFLYASKGLIVFFRTQPNAWIHLLAALVVTGTGLWFRISHSEWTALVICIGAVFASEMANTAIEFLTDMVSPEYNEKAGRVKDMAAASVLVSSLASVIVACIIFFPRLRAELGM